MDTMTWTKIIGASCGSLLILLLIQWVAEEFTIIVITNIKRSPIF